MTTLSELSLRHAAIAAGHLHYESQYVCTNGHPPSRIRYARPLELEKPPCLFCQMLRKPGAETSKKVSEVLMRFGVPDPRSRLGAQSTVEASPSTAPSKALAAPDWAPAGFVGGYPVTLDKGELPVFDARLDNLCGYYCFTVDGVAHHVGKTGRWKTRKGPYRSNPDAANRRIREWIRYHIRAGQAVHMWGLEADAPTQGEERAIAARLGATRWSGALPEMIDGCLRSAKAHLAHALTRSDDAAIATAALEFLAAFELQEAAR